MTTDVDKIREERSKTYGGCKPNHDNLGLVFTGILQQHYQIEMPHPLPGHVVALMMAALKATRASNPFGFNADNYLDGKAYFAIAEEIDDRNTES